jgi:outer membrane protein
MGIRTYQFLFLSLLATAVFAQQDPAPVAPAAGFKQPLLSAPAFPSPSWFRRHFSTPSRRVELKPVRRVEDHIVDGKLELSLRAYIELVMENNTDIAIERLNVEYPANSITRAFAPFDPTLAGSFTSQRTTAPTTSVLEGAQTLKTLSQPGGVSYSQLLPTGTSFSAGFSAQKYSTNNLFATYNPALSTNLSFGFEQPLLRDRGAYVNKLPVMIARSTLRMTRYQLQDRVITLLAVAENAYWDVVAARENLALQKKFLELRDTALQRAKKQLELGALLPLDIFQPQANYASAEVAVTQATVQLTRAENALREKIGADLDPKLRTLPIVLTEPVAPLSIAPEPDKEEAIQKALRLRPDLRAANQQLDVDDLNIQRTTNALRPGLSLVGGYTSQGRGGTFVQQANPFDPNSTEFISVPGGIGDALSQLFAFNFPVYSVGLRLSLPVRDRRSAADLADAMVRKRQDALRLRKLEQDVRLNVLNAADEFEASKSSIRQAQMARDFAQKRFEAEQKKYELGITSLFFVLDAQTELNSAENDLLRQLINYRRNMVSLYRMTGELLEVRGVVLD